MDIMVPIGKKAFIRGKLQHTNDILMSHNSNYFSLVSNSQANEILQARVVTCDEQMKAINKERKLFR
jgi:unconventional prefoldin RPB5 interactor 1